MNCPRITVGNGATATGTWPLITTDDVAFSVDRYYHRQFALQTGTKTLASYRNGRLIIHAGYASDGYSPVIYSPWGKPSDTHPDATLWIRTRYPARYNPAVSKRAGMPVGPRANG